MVWIKPKTSHVLGKHSITKQTNKKHFHIYLFTDLLCVHINLQMHMRVPWPVCR